MFNSRPRFEDLPLREGDPPWSAWGLYGPDDELGTLNLLSAQTVLKASEEIRTGRRFGLDLPIDYLTAPSHGRTALSHTVIWKAPRAVHDDEIAFNTQISTQWDGLRHIGYAREGLWYNGVRQPHISGEDGERTTTLGIHAWAKQGIVGRGVLVDYYHWRMKQHKPFDTQVAHEITLDEIIACAKDQNLEFQPGDILFIRSGWRVGYERRTVEEKLQWSTDSPTWIGVEASLRMVKWLWNTGFSACAGDAPAWECLLNGQPPVPDEAMKGYISHEIMIAGWGMPIGEYFDLEELSAECHRQSRSLASHSGPTASKLAVNVWQQIDLSPQ
ncbi:hypothetical protein PENARI_c005G09133 [Penicillium arizonense]|uniref:Cyclase n=1 Tax=Penicillium arizonense TaxID=1835702 RepID=A0A1F5LP67_PENAI|nr:hypothetical protein PENARI_c005G09133 [Penicillium arizonense]OGE54886.1 hypothetical protein PENARI_c005G09133 [Penicillium arizonense]